MAVALSLRKQIVPVGEIPMAEHDRRKDYIVTPDGILSRGQNILSIWSTLAHCNTSIDLQ